MNNLFKLYHGSEDNDFNAAKLELPLTFRVHEPNEGHNARIIKSSYILTTGSHHGFGLNALFAHKLLQELSGPGNSSDRMKALRNSNLEILTSNPHNIGAITQCMPEGCDPAKIIKLTFPGGQYGNFEKSDFYYFVKNVSQKLEEKPGPGMLLIAEIYGILLRSNHLEADMKLQKKIDAVITAAKA